MIFVKTPIVVGEETLERRLAIAEGALELQGAKAYTHTAEGTNVFDQDHVLIRDKDQWHFIKTPKPLVGTIHARLLVVMLWILILYTLLVIGAAIKVYATGTLSPVLLKWLMIGVVVVILAALALCFSLYIRHLVYNRRIRKEFAKP